MAKKKVTTYTKILRVRLTEEQYAYAQTQAASAGVPVSVFLRAAACGLSVQTKADAQVLRELRRLGGLCKHAILEGANTEIVGSTFKTLQNYAASLVR